MAPSKPNKPPKRLSAILLAAGLSRRMGPKNKLLLPFRGVPLVRHVASTIASAFPFVEVIVVTGHEAEAVEASLESLPIRIVHNAHYDEGQMTSVRTGLLATSADSDGVMVCLSDQPALDKDDIALISRTFCESERPVRVLVPTFGGERGNPIVLARESLNEILARGGNFGCRQFVAKNADVVTTFEMPNNHVLTDVDHPHDYSSLLKQTE